LAGAADNPDIEKAESVQQLNLASPFMNKTVVAIALFTLTVGGVVSWVLLTRPAQEFVKAGTNTQAEEPPKETWRDRVKTSSDGKAPVELADAEYSNLQDAKERLELIRWVSEQEWAGHKTPVLRKALVADTDEAVQLEALSQSVRLAAKYGSASIAEVIRTGLSVGNQKVVQQALREARKHPCVELVPDLLEVADSNTAHRFLAVDALAFTDDERARSKVIEVASRADGDKNERMRAIALLSKIKDDRAVQLLGQLTGDSDEEVRRVANEALAARNTN
jgi:hypothetical protein